MWRYVLALLTIMITISLLITGVIYTLARVLSPALSSTNSKAWKGLLKQLADHLKKRYPELVPWDKEMLSLLSMNLQEEKKPGWFDTISSGVFSSIYHEPVLAFAGQFSGKNGVTLARTSDREFVFRHKPKETEIWINQQPFGLYLEGSLISAGRGGKLIGRLEKNEQEAAFPVTIGDTTAATLSNPRLISSPNPRAIVLFREVDANEENVLLALAILNMTGRA